MGTMMRIIAALAMAAMLTGCAAFGSPPLQDQLTFCKGAAPFRPAVGETAKLADSTVAQIRKHNSVGAEACGWKPGG